MKKKLVELVIGENGLDGLGVDAIALVESPAIEENFLYFKEEKFVEPTAGESEGDFIGRCMSAIEGEFPDQDQRLAVCYSYWEGSEEKFLRENPCLPGYVAYGTKMKDGREVPNCVPDESSKKFQDEMNVDVLGYQTKNFEICPVAINLFKHLVDMNPDEEVAGMIRSAALQADAIFGIEKKVLADGIATKEDFYGATVIVKDFMDLMKEIDKEVGMEHSVDFMMGHLEVIGNLIPDSEFALDPSALPQYVDEITEDDKKKKDNLITEAILEAASRLGFSFETFADAKIAPNIGDSRDVEDLKENSGKGLTGQGFTIYRYEGPKPQRDFCKQMMSLNRWYTGKDIEEMENIAVNAGFGPKGASSTYSIWKYKGGVNCKHYWQKYYVNVNKNRVENKGKAPGIAGEAADAGNNYWSLDPNYRKDFSYECGCEDNSYHFNDEQRIATGPAMIPDYEMVRRADDGSKYWVYFTEETIRDIAEKFMREKRVDSTNLEHDSEDPRPKNYIYESWIIEDPEMDKAKAMGFNLPKGTWMVSMRIGDEHTWKLIKQGKIKGFSVEGFFGEMIQKS